MQLGKSLHLPKGQAQDFRTQAGAAHAEQERMLETRLLYVRSNFLQNFKMRELLVDDSKPTEPIAFVRPRPERGVPLPETRYFIVFSPVLDTRGNRTCKRAG